MSLQVLPLYVWSTRYCIAVHAPVCALESFHLDGGERHTKVQRQGFVMLAYSDVLY